MTLENDTASPAAEAPVVSHETTPAAETPAAEPAQSWDDAVDADLSAIYQKNNPERAPDGKFASKTPASPDEPITETTDQAQTKPIEQVQPAIEPPTSWSAEVKEIWGSLPPKAQEYIAKRESEAHDQISRQGQELSQLNPIRAVVEQNLDVFERNGLTPEDGMGRLLNAERLLEKNAPAAIAQIAQAYGVDLRALVQGQPAPPANAAEAALRSHIAQLEARLNETSNRIQEREARDAETEHEIVLSEIERFAQGKDDWAELETDVLAEITGLKASIKAGIIPAMPRNDILSKAYERAQRNNPAAWAKKQETERKAEEAKKVEEAQKRAEAAKRSNVVNISTPSATTKPAPTAWDDDTALRDIYRASQSKG